MIGAQPTGDSSIPPLDTVLRDGTSVLIRPVQSDDKHLLEIGMEHLSPEARYFRFFRPMKKIPPKLLDQFTEIDHVNHEAIGALDVSQPAAAPVGVARYIRLPEQETAAEVAVTVVDSHQGRGLGTLLLAVLAHAAVENKIQEFAAVVLRNNSRMLQVFKELGATTKLDTAGQVDIRVPLFRNPEAYPQTQVGDVFRQTAVLLANRGGRPT